MRFELFTYTKNQSLYWPNEKKNIIQWTQDTQWRSHDFNSRGQN